MKHSEIFEEYIKIAQDKKIISNSSESFKKLENNPRADSLDISAIEALYGVKPKAPENMSYKNNIMEIAHPSPKVISPAYDRLNGLVENNIERQNINLRIVNKNPDGLLTQRKYAQQQLLSSLVRVANDLDNKNEFKLANLTDNCLKHASQEFTLKKEALGPLAIIPGFIWRYAIILGLTAAYNNTEFGDEGFKSNSNQLIEHLDTLINSKIEYGGFLGMKYDEQFKSEVSQFRDKIADVQSEYLQSESLIKDMSKIASAKELKKLSENKTYIKNLSETLKSLQSKLDLIKPEIETVKKLFTDIEYKKEQIENKGYLWRLLDKAPLLTGTSAQGFGIFGDDFQDVVNILPTFETSLVTVINKIKNFINKKNVYTKQAADRLHQESKSKKTEKPKASFTRTKSKNQYQDQELPDLANEAGEAAKKEVKTKAKDVIKDEAAEALGL